MTHGLVAHGMVHALHIIAINTCRSYVAHDSLMSMDGRHFCLKYSVAMDQQFVAGCSCINIFKILHKGIVVLKSISLTTVKGHMERVKVFS